MRSVALFEVGTVFRMVGGEPEERPMAAIAFTGAAESAWTGRREYDFFDAKGAVDALMADLGIAWSLGEAPGPLFHPGRSAFVLVDGARVGVLGEIHPRVAESLDVPGRIATAELEIDELMRHAATTLQAGDVPRFPPSAGTCRSCSTRQVPHAAVESAIREAGGDLVAILHPVRRPHRASAAGREEELGVLGRVPRRPPARSSATRPTRRSTASSARVAEDLRGELRRRRQPEARARPPV